MLARRNALSVLGHSVPLKGISFVFVLAFTLMGLALWSGGGWAAPFWAPTPAMDAIQVAPTGDVAMDTLVQYTIRFRNTGDPANGVLTFTLPTQMDFVSATPNYAVNGNIVTWALTNFSAGSNVNYTVTAQLAVGTVVHDQLTYSAQLDLDGASTTPSRSGTHYVRNTTASKQTTTSLVVPNNPIQAAVAGELVTVTVNYPIPQGMAVYTVTPKVVLRLGLSPYASEPAWANVYTGTAATLRGYDTAIPTGNYEGVLVTFPNLGDRDASAITETVAITIYARQSQRRPVTGDDLTHGTDQIAQAILRWCNETVCAPAYHFLSDVTPASQIELVRPEVTFSFGNPVYLDANGIGEGNGQVRLIFNSANGNRPVAYDGVFTATLGPGLTHQTSSGQNTGAGAVSAGPGGVTYVVWNLPNALAANQSWQAVVTATLAGSFTIGREFTYTAAMRYDTFAGDVIGEGRYLGYRLDGVLRPGVALVKTASPGTNVTMGDRVTYTVVLKQGANTTLQSPILTDTLPLGFRYMPGTLAVVGGTLVDQRVAEGPATSGEYHESLGWSLATLAQSPTPRWVTATFVTLNTGWDFRDKAVHETAANMKAAVATAIANTGVIVRWTAPAGSSYTVSNKVDNANFNVIQPFMADNFATTRTDGNIPREVGGTVNLRISFTNNGAGNAATAIRAHELKVCDTLPKGLVFGQDNGCAPAATCPAYTPPALGSGGTICWTLYGVPKGAAYSLDYRADVTDAVVPGYVTNHATIADYTTKSGEVEGERHYSLVPDGIPDPVNCGAQCMRILGLEATNTPWQLVVEPGDYITYTLAYTDSSGINDYTGVVITDTYDTYLTYRGATPAPDMVDTDNHQLMWDIGSVANTSGQILLTLQVQDPLPDGVITLTNQMLWDSLETTAPAREQVVVTPLDVANLMVEVSGPDSTYASDQFVYTVVYTNVGPTNRPITLTFDYDPNFTFVSVTGDATQSDGSDHIFTGLAPANTLRQIQVTVRVKAPLNYAVAELESLVELASEGATSKTDSVVVDVLRPQAVMMKTSTSTTAPDAGNPVLYNFTVQNTGNFTATGCVITDTWEGSKLSFLSGGSDWTDLGNAAATWVNNPFSLAPGEIVTPSELTLRVDVNADHYENYLDIACDQIHEVPTFKHDLWKGSIETYKLPSDVIAFPGRVLTYTIYYTNTGEAPVQNAVITDRLPSGIVLEGYTQSDISGCLAGSTFGTQPGASGGTDVYWKCMSFAIDGSGSVQVWGTVAGTENTVIVNTTGSDGDGTVPYRPGTVDVPLVISRPRLSLTQTLVVAHPEYNNVAPDDLITYELAYQNRGTATANDVVFKVHLPTNVVSFVSAPEGAEAGGIVTWEIGDLRAGRGGVVHLTVRAKDEPGQWVVFDAGDLEISSRRLNDAQPDDETEYFYPVDVTINDHDLRLVKSVSAPSLAANALITYTLVLENIGGGTLTHVVLTDTLDNYLTVQSAPGCVHSEGSIPATLTGGTLTCTVGPIDQHVATHTLQIVARLGALPQGATFSNVAWGWSDQTPSEASNVVFVGGTAPHNLVLEPTIQSGVPPYVAPKQVYFNLGAEGSAPINFVITLGNGASASGTLPSSGLVNTTYQMSGTYMVIMTATNQLGSVVETYPITVTGEPDLQVSAMAVTVELLADGYTTRTLTISNGAGATDILNWDLAESPERAWLTPTLIPGTMMLLLPQASGTLMPGEQDRVELAFDAAGLMPGSTYTTTLVITGNDAPVVVDVTLNILAPTLAWAPTSLAAEAAEGSTAVLTRSLTIQNTAAVADLHWSISSTADWLAVSVSDPQTTAPSGQANVIVSFDPAGLTANTYTANLQITSDDPLHASAIVSATFTITSGGHYIYLPLVLRNTQ